MTSSNDLVNIVEGNDLFVKKRSDHRRTCNAAKAKKTAHAAFLEFVHNN